MNTIKIDGKDYIPVKERLLALRGEGHEYNIQTDTKEIMIGIHLAGWHVKATVHIVSGPRRGFYTGNAYEKIDPNDEINALNALENAETSAVGRALAFAGIGIEEAIASHEEIIRSRLKAKSEGNGKKGDNVVSDALKSIEMKKPKGYDSKPLAQILEETTEEERLEVEKQMAKSLMADVSEHVPEPAKEKPEPKPEPNPEHFKNALPDKWEQLFLDGKLDEYMLSLPWNEFKTILVQKKVPRATTLKRDVREIRLTGLKKLKDIIKRNLAEGDIPYEEPEEESPAAEAEPTEEQEQTVEIDLSEAEGEAGKEQQTEPMGGTLEENHKKTGNRYGIEVPEIPAGNTERDFAPMLNLWKQIQTMVKTHDAFEKKMETAGYSEKYDSVDDFLRSASTKEINEVLNTT
jgi:hypothetical protein